VLINDLGYNRSVKYIFAVAMNDIISKAHGALYG
jgi:hypothetical protein